MDRQIVYIGQSPQDTDLLLTNMNAYFGLAKLAAAILGTSTLFNNFECTPTAPASMTVDVSAGEIYSLEVVDDTAYGSIAPDTVNEIYKQGINIDTTNLSCPAPVTVGNSINYLVQIGFSELDDGDIILPYYDSANPSVPFTGPSNNPIPQNTIRQDSANITVKAGASAPTGTQTTPTPDAGFTGAYVVTVAHGQTTIVSGNISVYSGAPFITETLTEKLGIADLQSGASIYALDTGSANAYAGTYTPAITAYSTGMKLSLKIANANTTTSTLSVNGLAAKTIKYTTGSNIIANDLIVGMLAQFEYDGTNIQLLNPATQVSGGILSVVKGGTGVSSVTTSPTASSFAGWDANSNFSANRFLEGYTTTATAAGTTTLTVSSTSLQYFTGSTTQTVKMPVTSTLVLGGKFTIQNRSTGVVTVQSSGSNTIIAMEANTQAVLTCILTSGTSAASWDYSYSVVQGALPVDDGGTGVSSTTAYAVLCGGTTSTGALQPIASVGALNSVLASNGAGALPTMKTIATLGLITQVTKQVFTASGTYTPTAGMVYCIVEGVGGGGGTGGISTTATTSAGSGGGGSGGFGIVTLTAAQIGASKTVTIGAAGSAGSAGANNGGNGGATSLGVLLQVGGGSLSVGTTGASNPNLSAGGAGGTATTGDLLIAGQGGSSGYWNLPSALAFGGNGGISRFGYFGPGTISGNGGTVGGSVASGYGAGGGGAAGGGTINSVAGAAGTAGVIYITEFISA